MNSMTTVSAEIWEFFDHGYDSAVVIAQGYRPGTVYGVLRRWRKHQERRPTALAEQEPIGILWHYTAACPDCKQLIGHWWVCPYCSDLVPLESCACVEDSLRRTEGFPLTELLG
jgi:hypothetical protein